MARAWREANPEKVAAYNERRRAAYVSRRRVPREWTAADSEALREQARHARELREQGPA